MAAVRRSSDSGLYVALAIFVILAFVGLGGAFWFYDQLSTVREATVKVQNDFGETVNAVFKDNQWEMTVQSPDEHGIKYTKESFVQTAQKLAEAAEYEAAKADVLGWQSLDGMASALADSPLQRDVEDQGVGAYPKLDDLLLAYGEKYADLKREVADLTQEKDTLNARLQESRDAKNKADDAHRQALQAKAAEYSGNLAQHARDLADMTRQRDQERQRANDAQAKYQAEADGRRTEVADLRREVSKWQGMYDDAVAPPGERETLVAEGEVLQVDSENDFVIIDGGRKRGAVANERYVVYSVQPDGSNLRKGMILVGKVNEFTSVATITEESKKYILEGDSYVSIERWNHFNRDDIVETGAGG